MRPALPVVAALSASLLLSACKLSGESEAASPSTPLPRPGHPGNVFLEGENVAIKTPPLAKWTMRDFDGALEASGESSNGELDFGKLPAGWRLLEARKADGEAWRSSVSVLPKIERPLPEGSPIGVSGGMFFLHFRKAAGRVVVQHSPEDSASLLALAGVKWTREWIWWEKFDYLSKGYDPLAPWAGVPERNFKACKDYGVKVASCEYGTPDSLMRQDPPPSQVKPANRRPPDDLTAVYKYFQEIARRHKGLVDAWETWNEPESLAGGLLSYEIAALQKAACLGVKSSAPEALSLMGFGRLEHPEALAANGYLSYVDVYNSHCHSKIDAEARERLKICREGAEGKPLWLTESSTWSVPSAPGTVKAPPLERLQELAWEVPKIYARGFSRGVSVVFYFNFYLHSEMNGQFFGVCDGDGSLAVNPGYNAIACAAKWLGPAKSAEELEGLPDFAEGYGFASSFNGRPARILLAWSLVPERSFELDAEGALGAWDAIGRPLETKDGRLRVGKAPVYAAFPEETAGKTLAKRQSPSGKLCPIVITASFPERLKSSNGDFVSIPAGGEGFSIPLEIYNFSDSPASGRVKASVAGAEGMERSFDVAVKPFSMAKASVAVKMPRDGELAKRSSRLKLEGSFPGLGESVLAIDLKPAVESVESEDKELELDTAANPKSWETRICKDSSMKTLSKDGWTLLDIDFKEAENRVANVVWAAPSHTLSPGELPDGRVDAIAIDFKRLAGTLRKAAIMLVEEDGAAYEGALRLDAKSLDAGGTSLLPLSTMSNPSYRKKDGNGKLDVEKIRSVEIAIYGSSNEKCSVAFKKLRWVSFAKAKEQERVAILSAAQEP